MENKAAPLGKQENSPTVTLSALQSRRFLWILKGFIIPNRDSGFCYLTEEQGRVSLFDIFSHKEENKTNTTAGKKIANTDKGSAKQISTRKPICIHPTQPHPIHNESDRLSAMKDGESDYNSKCVWNHCGLCTQTQSEGLKWVQNQNSVSLYFSPRPCWEKGTAFQISIYRHIRWIFFFSFANEITSSHIHASGLPLQKHRQTKFSIKVIVMSIYQIIQRSHRMQLLQ